MWNLFKQLPNIGLLFFTFVCIINVCYGIECGQEEFVRCAEPLNKLQLTSQFQFGKNEDLDDLCLELRRSVRCIQSFTRRCLNLNQRNHFNKMYYGTNQFIRDLCNDETFQQEYLKYSTCAQTAKDEFEICAKRYKNALVFMNSPSNENNQKNQTLTDNVKTICCSYQELIDCSEEIAQYKCGYDAGKFVRNLLQKIGTNLVKLHCDKYSKEPELCGHSKSGANSLKPEKNFFKIVTNVLVIAWILFKFIIR